MPWIQYKMNKQLHVQRLITVKDGNAFNRMW